MKYFALLVFVAGLTIAAWYASYIPVTDEPLLGLARIGAWFSQAGIHFSGGIALMVAGAITARVANKPEEDTVTKRDDAEGGPFREGKARAFPQALAMLEEISAEVEALDGSDLPARSAELAAALEKVLEEQVPAFLEHRQRLIDSLGLEVFAEMIGHFATMERGTARAWSALTDGSYPEVATSIEKAKRGARASQETLRGKRD